MNPFSVYSIKVDSLQEKMKQGKLRQVPLRVLFYTFYGLLVVPFTTKDLTSFVFCEEGETFYRAISRLVKRELTWKNSYK